jgi:ribonuclease HI
MELTAVIQAIKQTPADRSIIIRTDSQYVTEAVAGHTTVKSNSDLWNEYREIAKTRKIKVVWVKGHAGDMHNEAADGLALQYALQAKAEVLRASAASSAA